MPFIFAGNMNGQRETVFAAAIEIASYVLTSLFCIGQQGLKPFAVTCSLPAHHPTTACAGSLHEGTQYTISTFPGGMQCI